MGQRFDDDLLQKPDVLKTRTCADWMGCSTEWIRLAIKTGVTAPDGRVVQLKAATMPGRRRPTYQIYRDDFIAFLTAIGWPKIPRPYALVPPFPDAQEAVS